MSSEFLEQYKQRIQSKLKEHAEKRKKIREELAPLEEKEAEENGILKFLDNLSSWYLKSIQRINEKVAEGEDVKLTAWEEDTWFVKEINNDIIPTNVPSMTLEDIGIQCQHCDNSQSHYLLMHYYRSVDDFDDKLVDYNKWLICFCPVELEYVDLGRKYSRHFSRETPFPNNEVIVKPEKK